MKFKAIVFDTQNGKPMRLQPRWIDLDGNGKAVRMCGNTGTQYHDFHLWVEGQNKALDEFCGDDPDGTYYGNNLNEII